MADERFEVTGPEYVRPDQRRSEPSGRFEVTGPAYLRPGERAPEPTTPAQPPMTREEQAKDIATSAASGIARGFIGMPGIPGSLAQLYDVGPAGLQYYYSRLAPSILGGKSQEEATRIYDQAMERLRVTQTPREQAGLERRIFGVPLPTSAGIVRDYIPGLEYEAKTPVGRIAGVTGEFVGGSPIGAPIKAAQAVRGVPGAFRAFTEATAIPSVAGGLASGTVGEALSGTEWEGLGRVAGAVAGTGAGSLGQARFLPSAQREAGARLAGDVARSQLSEQPTRWERYARSIAGRRTPAEETAISRLEVQPGTYASGVTPTPGQLLRDEIGIRGLERLPQEPTAPTAPGARAESRLALGQEASLAPTIAAQSRVAPTMADVLNLPVQNNPMAFSSTAARNVFDAVHDTYLSAKENAWNNPAISQAQYKFREVANALDNAIDQMGNATYQNMPAELRRYVENLYSFTGGVPLTELQKVKQFANSIMRNPYVMDKSGASALTTILDDVMTNTQNVLPRYMTGATYTQAAPAWDAARTATSEYYKAFGTDLLKNLAARYEPGTPQAGQPLIPAAQMLDRALGNPRDALRNFNELSSIPGIDRTALNQAVSDWVIGKITKNGKDINVSQVDIDRFLRNPGDAAIVSQVPGLSDRLSNIATQSRADRVIAGFNNVLQDNKPETLLKFIRNNRNELDQVFSTPVQQNYLSRLERSAEVLQPLTEGMITPAKIQQFLQNGDLFSVLHGFAGGSLGRVGAGYLAGSVLGQSFPMTVGLELLGAGAGALGITSRPTEIASRLVYGPLRQHAAEILQRATTDPKLMQELLRKPTIQDILNPFSVSGWAHGLTEIAPEAGMAAFRGTRESEERRLPQRFAGGRVGRASGGRLVRNDHAARAAALIRAADAAKKAHNKTTEDILEQPDEAVAKALSIANKAI